MGFYFVKKSRTSEEFMVAGRSIPAWAAGLAVMSTYTSSISYIATPGKAFETNWNPIIFSVCIFPVAWVVCRYIVAYYRQMHIISVYQYLENALGPWARVYGAFCFLFLMVGRVAVILYLVSLVIANFLPWDLWVVITVIGAVTILYTLLGGMEAVIWTDVMQSIVMIAGILFCVVSLSMTIFAGETPLIQAAIRENKFSWGSWDLSLSSRTVWVVIIYGLVENMRNLVSDQNFVQKYSSVASEREAKQSIWIAMLIYIPMTAVFLYIGTALFAFYSPGGALLPEIIDKGDKVFPYYIATEVPVGLKGLILAAIIAAAMSTIDSALNCSATVYLLDFHKRYIKPVMDESESVFWLRLMTVFWGVLGIGFALVLMVAANDAMLDMWWAIAGIFGGGILGLFILALFKVRLHTWQGITAIGVSILVIAWGTFARNLPEQWKWLECSIESILIGTLGIVAMLVVAYGLSWFNRRSYETV
jgi:SSS family solute:Na+ symporter